MNKATKAWEEKVKRLRKEEEWKVLQEYRQLKVHGKLRLKKE